MPPAKIVIFRATSANVSQASSFDVSGPKESVAFFKIYFKKKVHVSKKYWKYWKPSTFKKL